MKYRPLIIGMALAVMVSAGSVHAQELSKEQQGELMIIGVGFTQKGALLESMIQGKMTELALELKREGCLDSEEAAKESSKRANAILKDVGGLYGQFIRTKVEFVVKAKNVLTLE